VNLLLSFMGASLGWAFGWQAFIDKALLAYMSGATAQDVFDALEFDEFSQVGSVLRVAATGAIRPERVNAEAFARCVPTATFRKASSSLDTRTRLLQRRGSLADTHLPNMRRACRCTRVGNMAVIKVLKIAWHTYSPVAWHHLIW
jgi:hypothetical protein